jgi:hypothetical protein
VATETTETNGIPLVGWVITIPSSGGYGGPTAYFLLQGLGCCLERSATGMRLRRGHPGLARLYTAALALLPLGLLFPAPFLDRVVAPMLQAIHALQPATPL